MAAIFMPYSFPNNVPRLAKNWSDPEKRKCVAAANAALKEGSTESEAVFACIAAAGKSKKDSLRMDAIVPLVIQQKKAIAKATGKKFKLPKTPYPKDFRHLSRTYFADLLAMLNFLKSIIQDNLINQINSIQVMAASERPKTDSARNDTFIDMVDSILQKASLMFYSKYSDAEVQAITRKQADRINKFSSDEFQRIFGKVLGINPIVVEPWLPTEVKAFTKQNVSLIKSIPQQYFERVEQGLMRDVQAGKSTKEITENISNIYNVSKSRAALIARDQTAKFNSNLNMVRQKSVGVTKYMWSTSMDERVRPSHAENEGKIFSWDDPPSETGNPGDDINCVPEDSIVSLHAPAIKAYRRWHTGQLTEIVTDSGETLRLTPNHPVLTSRGWVAAHLIKMSDYLIQAPDQIFNPFVGDPKSGDSTAKKMFCALRNKGLFHRVSGRASRFHGDAAGEDVDVVEIKRMLKIKWDSNFSQSIGNDFFTIANNLGSGESHSSSRDVAFPFAPNSIMGGFRPFKSLSQSRIFHSLKHGFTSPSNGNAALNQNPSDWCPADFQFLSDEFLAIAVQIHPNNFIFRKIRSVMSYPWSGFVHNFETVTGWFSSVNLIVHNCRCVALPVFDETE